MIPMQLHEVPLLDSTVEENEDKFALANSVFEDLTASNIAILALLLVLCFIPISPMADVSQTAALIYALFTDLFSAVPLIVKGAELLIKFNQNPRTTHSETWVFGSNDARLTEIWSTQCKITVNRGTGVLIIVSALWAITVGLVTEYLAWRWVSSRKRSAKHIDHIRQVGLDTYHVRSKYLTKMLNGTSSPSKTTGGPGTPDMPGSPRSSIGTSPADFRMSIVTPRGSLAGSVDSPPAPVPYSDDEPAVDEMLDGQVRSCASLAFSCGTLCSRRRTIPFRNRGRSFSWA